MYFLLALCLQAMYDNLRSRGFYPLGNVLLLSTLKSVNICNYLSTPQVTAGLFGEKKNEDGSTISDKIWRKDNKKQASGLKFPAQISNTFLFYTSPLYLIVTLTTQNLSRCKCMSFCVYALTYDHICLFAFVYEYMQHVWVVTS